MKKYIRIPERLIRNGLKDNNKVIIEAGARLLSDQLCWERFAYRQGFLKGSIFGSSLVLAAQFTYGFIKAYKEDQNAE